MDENTKHTVASNLTVAFYVGQAYHFPYNDPSQKKAIGGPLDALQVVRAYQQILRLMDSEQVGVAGNVDD